MPIRAPIPEEHARTKLKFGHHITPSTNQFSYYCCHLASLLLIFFGERLLVTTYRSIEPKYKYNHVLPARSPHTYPMLDDLRAV